MELSLHKDKLATFLVVQDFLTIYHKMTGCLTQLVTCVWLWLLWLIHSGYWPEVWQTFLYFPGLLFTF